jgi:hypothetical protein
MQIGSDDKPDTAESTYATLGKLTILASRAFL